MRTFVWNAYASNNSGSYTIVGRLPSVEVAEATAAELRTVIDTHTAWLEEWDGGDDSLESSPLAQFCRDHALFRRPGQGGWEDWPQYHDDNRPSVVVVGSQLIVHHPYTVSLPPTFGELFYKRGGRVEHEEDHAHHPIVVTATFWWGWTKEAKQSEKEELPKLVAELAAPNGPLALPNNYDCPPAWRLGGGKFGEAPLTVAAVFDDLVAGVAALRAAGAAHGAELNVRLAEAQGKGDPLAFLRPGHG